MPKLLITYGIDGGQIKTTQYTTNVILVPPKALEWCNLWDKYMPHIGREMWSKSKDLLTYIKGLHKWRDMTQGFNRCNVYGALCGHSSQPFFSLGFDLFPRSIIMWLLQACFKKHSWSKTVT